MDERDAVREFLTSRRARLSPADVGLPDTSRRRVAGLRRDEVAVLAGVSSEYYARLERGQLAGVSDKVLDALARALRLDEAEQVHLRNLAYTASAPKRGRLPRARPAAVRASVQQLLDALVNAPAYVFDSRVDIVASNELARALLSPVYEFAAITARPPNTARFAFLDPTGPRFYPEWDQLSRELVAVLRAAVGHDPFDRPLTDLIGELSSRSDVFRTLWAAHDVGFHLTGAKHFRHPDVGLLALDYEAMPLPGDRGGHLGGAAAPLTLVVYTAAAGTPTADTLALLASLSAESEASPSADHQAGQP